MAYFYNTFRYSINLFRKRFILFLVKVMELGKVYTFHIPMVITGFDIQHKFICEYLIQLIRNCLLIFFGNSNIYVHIIIDLLKWLSIYIQQWKFRFVFNFHTKASHTPEARQYIGLIVMYDPISMWQEKIG